MTNSGGFTSILSDDGTMVGDTTEPGCLNDLYLNQIIAPVTTGHADENPEHFFYAPLRDAAPVRYRHYVFRDLERHEVRQPIENFMADPQIGDRHHQRPYERTPAHVDRQGGPGKSARRGGPGQFDGVAAACSRTAGDRRRRTNRSGPAVTGVPGFGIVQIGMR